MPSREQTVRDTIQTFEHADYPSGLTAATGWLGIYQTKHLHKKAATKHS
jgi:hypothetical protein